MTPSAASRCSRSKVWAGVGKTVLAQALAFDEAVKAGFPDGVVWIDIGREPTEAKLIEGIRDAVRVVGESDEGMVSLNEAEKALPGHLQEKAALLFFDDVWEDLSGISCVSS